MQKENRVEGSNESEHKQKSAIMGERNPGILGIDKDYFEKKQEMKNEDKNKK